MKTIIDTQPWADKLDDLVKQFNQESKFVSIGVEHNESFTRTNSKFTVQDV